jgi:hypothetical protein
MRKESFENEKSMGISYHGSRRRISPCRLRQQSDSILCLSSRRIGIRRIDSRIGICGIRF